MIKFKDQEDIERKVISFIIQLKEEGKNFRSIRNYLTPIISFYKINDIMLNSKKINKFMPTETRAKKNRGYEHEEVQKMLDIADERMRAVILLLVSSGCRIGAIPTLHVRDIEKSGDVYKITIYENDAEEYFSFITVEAWNAVQSFNAPNSTSILNTVTATDEGDNSDSTIFTVTAPSDTYHKSATKHKPKQYQLD